jgi:hypothetical protein
MLGSSAIAFVISFSNKWMEVRLSPRVMSQLVAKSLGEAIRLSRDVGANKKLQLER